MIVGGQLCSKISNEGMSQIQTINKTKIFSRVVITFCNYELFFHVIETRKPYSYIKYEFSPLEGFVGGKSSIIKISSEDLVQDLFSN